MKPSLISSAYQRKLAVSAIDSGRARIFLHSLAWLSGRESAKRAACGISREILRWVGIMD